ncbi:hypothetical protein ABZ863_16520 [Saccharomonospora sp. NPDC046836]|uniref:Rv2732c family membrane protein n=1 Tax=Saccharomonospora sp. NPDC046836 TaxID=3156921 RepID=UPI0033D1D676
MSGEDGNGQRPSEGDAAGLDELGADVDAAVSRAAKTVEFGRRGFGIAIAVFGVVVGLLLPWVGDHVGWQVLAGEGGAIPRLFATTSALFGVLAAVAALSTRRWWLCWVCAIGSWISAVDGFLAIWSQQSSTASGAAGGGPGIGMVLAVACMLVLGVQWMRVAWSRD